MKRYTKDIERRLAALEQLVIDGVTEDALPECDGCKIQAKNLDEYMCMADTRLCMACFDNIDDHDDDYPESWRRGDK